MHLAQINIGRFRYPTDDPRMAGFMDNLDRVNAIADKMPGFVWRLQDESGNATAIDGSVFGLDMAVNMSVWETPEALERFVWQTVHKRFYNRKPDWFSTMTDQHFAMWWIEPGHVPTLEEAAAKLSYLRENGPSDEAFGWESLPGSQLWREARCA